VVRAEFDTETNECNTLAPMLHACSWTSVNVVCCLVYFVEVGAEKRDVLRFDPISEVFSAVAPTVNSRKYGCSFALGGCLYAVGGLGADSSVERYDVANNNCSRVANFCLVALPTSNPWARPKSRTLLARSSTRYPGKDSELLTAGLSFLNYN
jgi:hypothetical protein